MEVRHDRGPRPVYGPGRDRGLPRGDYRADLHEFLAGLPRFRRDGRRPGVFDSHLVLLADRQSIDLLLRMDAGPAGSLRLSGRHRLLLDFVGHGGDYDGRAAFPDPSHPQQGGTAELRRHGPMLRRHVPAVQRPFDGRARHRVPLGIGRHEPRRVGVEDRRKHPLPLRRTAQQSRPGLFRYSRPSPTWPTATTCR